MKKSATIIPEFTVDSRENTSSQYRSHICETLRYFDGRIRPDDLILDIGARSRLTDALEDVFGCKGINTTGDLDFILMPDMVGEFNMVIYSHTIEHQFNPLVTLSEINKLISNKATLYILLPERGKLLWDKGHFHEIDEYRLRLLLKRSGFKVLSKERQKVWRKWWFYLTGIRPFMRLFFEFHAVYECRKETDFKY